MSDIPREEVELTAQRLARVAAMPGPSDVLVCDGCGDCWPEDEASNCESCIRCGRFKQRMEWATVRDVAKDGARVAEVFSRQLLAAMTSIDALVTEQTIRDAYCAELEYQIERLKKQIKEGQ